MFDSKAKRNFIADFFFRIHNNFLQLLVCRKYIKKYTYTFSNIIKNRPCSELFSECALGTNSAYFRRAENRVTFETFEYFIISQSCDCHMKSGTIISEHWKPQRHRKFIPISNCVMISYSFWCTIFMIYSLDVCTCFLIKKNPISLWKIAKIPDTNQIHTRSNQKNKRNRIVWAKFARMRVTFKTFFASQFLRADVAKSFRSLKPFSRNLWPISVRR